MGYDYAGGLLPTAYHQMSCKAHRIMNRFSRLMSMYLGKKETPGVTLLEVISFFFQEDPVSKVAFWAKLQELDLRKSTYDVEMPILPGSINRQ